MIKINWIEKKSDTWKVATVEVEGQTYKDVSINRTDKNGRLFPNFDGLAAGMEIEGTLYTNKMSGKHSIYPPREQTNAGGAYRGSGKPSIVQAMQKKDESIAKFQGNKEESIKISSTMRDAVLLAIAEFDKELHPASRLEERIKYYREWLWKEWEGHKDYPPFN